MILRLEGIRYDKTTKSKTQAYYIVSDYYIRLSVCDNFRQHTVNAARFDNGR